MDLTELIDKLQAIKDDHGNLPCLILTENGWRYSHVDNLRVDDRYDYGLSVLITDD